jgi:MiaB/RimO family radical SAM methylthiotransferase
MLLRRLASRRAVSGRTFSRRALPQDGKGLSDFVSNAHAATSIGGGDMSIASWSSDSLPAAQRPRTFYIETFGCAMNVADTEIVTSIMEDAGYSKTGLEDAAVVLANTCAIRDNAEAKVWQRLVDLRITFDAPATKAKMRPAERVVGVLGCMAERLKTQLMEPRTQAPAPDGSGSFGTGAQKVQTIGGHRKQMPFADVVAGPDAYRDLPRLIDVATASSAGAGDAAGTVVGELAMNVQLSLEETYADIKPVRISPDAVSAFIAIMRGCNNMCSFCIVPFTRGRERSRSAGSVAEEVARLSAEGVREVVLLGQNVNSYHDRSKGGDEGSFDRSYVPSGEGWRNTYMGKSRTSMGIRFAELLATIAAVDPEMRIRFTSPHPKDFPPDLLDVISRHPNCCKSLHMPAQSGSSDMLQAMRRGYSRELYLELVAECRAAIPGVALTSDFISGFCGETDEDHEQTLSLLQHVGFDAAFMFAYSRREKTHAAHKLEDDVPAALKKKRLAEVIAVFRESIAATNAVEAGRLHVVLVEGESKRSRRTSIDGQQGPVQWQGRSDTNKRILFDDEDVPASASAALAAMREGHAPGGPLVKPKAGDYVLVEINADGAGPQSLKSQPLAITTLREMCSLRVNADEEGQRGAMFVDSREAWLRVAHDIAL